MTSKEAILSDMSEAFIISIKVVNEKMKFIFSNKKHLLKGKDDITCLTYESEIDNDVLGNICHSFNEFPKWW